MKNYRELAESILNEDKSGYTNDRKVGSIYFYRDLVKEHGSKIESALNKALTQMLGISIKGSIIVKKYRPGESGLSFYSGDLTSKFKGSSKMAKNSHIPSGDTLGISGKGFTYNGEYTIAYTRFNSNDELVELEFRASWSNKVDTNHKQKGFYDQNFIGKIAVSPFGNILKIEKGFNLKNTLSILNNK